MKCVEMWRYVDIIRQAKRKWGGVGWRAYDEQFRALMAVYPRPWSIVEQGLWSMCVTCPQHPAAPLSGPLPPQHNTQAKKQKGGNNSNNGGANNNVNKGGNPQQGGGNNNRANGQKPVCRDYQMDVCRRFNCKYPHVCAWCKGPHPGDKCPNKH